MSTAILVVQFEWPDDGRLLTEWNRLVRECIDPLRRENIDLIGWKVATGELESV